MLTKMLKFYVKVYKTFMFSKSRDYLNEVRMIIDVGPRVQGHRLRNFMLKFCVKVFKIS